MFSEANATLGVRVMREVLSIVYWAYSYELGLPARFDDSQVRQ